MDDKLTILLLVTIWCTYQFRQLVIHKALHVEASL